MQKYDTYTPEINYGEEIATADNQQTDSSKPSSVNQRKKKTSRREHAKKNPVKPILSKPSFFSRFKSAFTSTQFRILAGIFIGCLTVYLAVAFCSYFTTCIADQSKIASSAVGSLPNVENPGGEGGARLSELLINRSFGLGSLVIIFWLGAISLKLLVKYPRFKTLDFTIKCLVALVTVSLIIGLITYNMHTSVNWGGYHGTYVNEFIIGFIGNIGAVLLSIFMIAVFVVICMRDLINWILKIRRERAERRRQEAEERAAREAREAEIRRMQEQERIDDLKAGESAEITPSGNIDAGDDELVDFVGKDTSIYDIDNDITPEPMRREVSVAQTASSVLEPYSTVEPVKNADETDKSEAELISDNASEAAADGDEKMVVNVNEIGKSDHDSFHSDLEYFENQHYKFPPYELLTEGKQKAEVDPEELLENKRQIKSTLLDFGIPITRIEATVGPTVTLYEIVPESGVKIAKIRSLTDDIALRLSAKGVRIIAPIPGKGTVGIEVANKEPQTVSMRTVIQSRKYQETRYNLPVALGSTISNDVYIADLARMPHLLVAGATGQGKSVGLNAIIASLLYCKAPHEVKFVMIDPKQVEFALYNKLKNYYMASIPGNEDEPVITDMAKVEATLNSLCVEMEERYRLLKGAQVRNIEEYNAKIRACQLNPSDGHRFMPYIVVVVDEFADLIMVSGKSVETPIARLAQKARAVGMHVILATQRPSVNVITGMIKANFPARIAFKVMAMVDSKTILDTPGAQQLIGNGDMLIFNNSEMLRVQCAFIRTSECEAICDYISRQPYPQGVFMLPEPPADGAGASGGGETGPVGDRDTLLVEVARNIVQSGRASTSAIQRSYEIGYNRAGRIMDQLERLGVVGPSQGGKPRAVLVDPARLEEILMSLE